MRKNLLGLALLMYMSGVLHASPGMEWQLLIEDKFVSVYVERSLYRTSGNKGFFVHVRIYNRTHKKLGVDLRDRFSLIYPNQWGLYQKPHRDAIDEERMIPPKMDPALKQKLTAAFHTGALTEIGDSLDYYREFYGQCPEANANSAGNFLIVSMGGWLLFSDGESGDMASLEQSRERPFELSEVVLPLPLQWKNIPTGARVF